MRHVYSCTRARVAMVRSPSCGKNIVPMGGPAGGDGGRGGSVIFEVNEGMSTLLDFKYQPRLIARDGESAAASSSTARPPPTWSCASRPAPSLIDDESGEVLADMVLPGERKVIAQGGEGGKGNIHFATSTRRSPRIATPGTAGEQRWVRLELRLVAEVGLVGLPERGKIHAAARAHRRASEGRVVSFHDHHAESRPRDDFR